MVYRINFFYLNSEIIYLEFSVFSYEKIEVKVRFF